MSLRLSRSAGLVAALALVAATGGCLRPGFDDPEAPTPPQNQPSMNGDQPEQPPGQPGAYGPEAPPAPGQFAPQPAAPQGPPPGPYGQVTPPAAPQQAPAAPPPGWGNAGPLDPINLVDQQWLRGEASRVIVELIRALPANQNVRVRDVPLNADTGVGEVNAFAACDDAGKPLMAISDGLLQIEAHVAQFRATDEIFGTHKLDSYLRMVASNMRPNQPIPRPAAGFVDPAQHLDGRKIARQHVLMDEQLAFVLGHELAHHYLGHTGCANGQGGSRDTDANRIGRRVVGHTPLNQLLEGQADVAGIDNVLTAGSRRSGAKWNEEGALLTLDFFSQFEGISAGRVALSILSTHPHPGWRRAGIQLEANRFRGSNGAPFQFPSLPGIFGG